MINVGINGFGRIGRLVARRLLSMPDVRLVRINDLTDPATLAHLFKYDSVHGRYPGHVGHEEGALLVEGQRIGVSAQKDPAQLAWSQDAVQVVVEATGLFTARDKAQAHLQAGAQKVVISAPATGEVDATLVLGVNDDRIHSGMTIVSNASCTTNCLAPVVKVLDDAFGLERGYMNTVHAYTADQRLQDAPHKDLRRARAAAINMVPTSTGAAKAVGLVLPHLKGKLDGLSVRVPVPDGSFVDLTAELRQDVDAQRINEAVKAAAEGPLKGILEFSTDPLVSSDIVGNPHSSVFDSQLTSVLGGTGRLVKVFSWYDNEWGYANRTAELVVKLANAR